MAFGNSYCVSTSTRVEQSDFPVSASRHEECTGGVERQTLYSIPMPTQNALCILRTAQIPELDGMLARSGRKDVIRRWVPRNLPHTSRRNIDPQHRIKIHRLPTFRTPPVKSVRVEFPDEGFAVFAGGGDDGVVEGGPGGVEDWGGVAPGEGDDVGEFGGEVVGEGGEGGGEGEDGEGSSAGCVPVYADVFLGEVGGVRL